MFTRLLASGLVACGLIAAGSIAADTAAARTHKGKTAQGYTIKVATKEQKLKLLRFEADLKCRNGTTLTLIESGFLWTKTKGNGSFRDAQFGRTDSVYFKGRMTENRIRGKVRLTDKLRGVKCSSRWIGFNLKR
jgi:hypothetical protein